MTKDTKIILTKTIGKKDAKINVENWNQDTPDKLVHREIELFLQAANQLNQITKIDPEEKE